MNKLTLPFVLAGACALSAIGWQGSLNAGELNPAHLPVDAKWVLHLDLEQILASKIVEEVREARPRLTQYVRSWIQGQYGIDPQTDMHAVTMYSRSYHTHTGTVILHANYDAEKVEADIQNKSGVETKQWNDHTLYTLTLAKHRDAARKVDEEAPEADDEADKVGDNEGHDPTGGKQMTIVLVDEKTVVFASSVQNAEETLKLLAGDAESLEGSDSKLLSGDWKEAMMYGAAIDLQEVGQSIAPMPVLKQHEQITWIIKKSGEKASQDITLIAKSEEVAESMEQFVRGIVAYERLWAAESEPLTKVVEAIKVSRNGKEVKVLWEAESGLVVDAFDDLMERYREWKPLMRRRTLAR